jgi:hypothetical protein
MLHAIVHAADIQDRDGGLMVMATLFGLYPFLLKPTGAIRDRNSARRCAISWGQINVEIVKRSNQAKGFVILPKRRVVERTLAWLGRCRCLAKDWECLNQRARGFLLLASIRLMVRRLCRK